MSKHKQLPVVTEAKQLAAWGAVEAMAKKVMVETEQSAAAQNFAEFLLSGSGSRTIVKMGNSVFHIEG